jgi:hypothetical protein
VNQGLGEGAEEKGEGVPRKRERGDQAERKLVAHCLPPIEHR